MEVSFLESLHYPLLVGLGVPAGVGIVFGVISIIFLIVAVGLVKLYFGWRFRPSFWLITGIALVVVLIRGLFFAEKVYSFPVAFLAGFWFGPFIFFALTVVIHLTLLGIRTLADESIKNWLTLRNFEVVALSLTLLPLLIYLNLDQTEVEYRKRKVEPFYFNNGDTLAFRVSVGDSVYMFGDPKFQFVIKNGESVSDTFKSIPKDSKYGSGMDVWAKRIPTPGWIVLFSSKSDNHVLAEFIRKDSTTPVLSQIDLCSTMIFKIPAEDDTIRLKSNDQLYYYYGDRSGTVAKNTEFVFFEYPEEKVKRRELVLAGSGSIGQRLEFRGWKPHIANQMFGFRFAIVLIAIGLITLIYNLTLDEELGSSKRGVYGVGIPSSTTWQTGSVGSNIGTKGNGDQSFNQDSMEPNMDEIERRAEALMSQLQNALQPKGMWDHYQSVKQSRRSTENLAEMAKLFSTMSEAINSASGVITAQNAFEVAQIKRSNLKELALLEAEVDKLRLKADIVEQKARAAHHEDEMNKQTTPPSPPPQHDHSKSSAEVHRERIIEEFTQRNLRQDLEIKSVAKAAQDIAELKKQLLALDMPESDVEAIIDNLKNRLLDQMT